MKIVSLAAISLCVAGVLGVSAYADSTRVKFPNGFERGVKYATVNRGNIQQDLYTSRDAIAAIKAGEPFPSGTVITLVDSRDGKLFQYVVMEKRAGWGADYAPDKRNGEWEFQAFNADQTVNRSENLDRCFGCHKGQVQADFVFTRDRIKATN
jgi:Cytochrome P460